MSIALESNSNRIERGSGFIGGMSCITMFDSPESGRPVDGILSGDLRFPMTSNLAITSRKVEETDDRQDLDSCSSSSIGRNSDLSGRSSDDEGSGEAEVQSSYKGPLDTMDSLEDVLPIRRGISKFYCGKSKSFTSLADASSSAVKDIAKPDNPYSRKRKNLLAFSSNLWDKNNRNFPLRSNSGGISKRPTIAGRSTLALAVAMSSSDSNLNNTATNSDNSNSNSSSTSPSPPRRLPPLHPRAKPSSDSATSSSPPPPLRRSFSPWRSFSLADLQSASSANAAPITGTSSSSTNKRENLNSLH